MNLFLFICYLVNTISYRCVYNPIKKIPFQLFQKNDIKKDFLSENLNYTEAIKNLIEKLTPTNRTKTLLEKVQWDDGEIPWDIEYFDF
jgi:hypothetical protein